MGHPGARRLLLLASAILLLAACTGGGGGGGGGATLKGVCPDTVVVQTDWFPGAQYGALYQLIGDKGTVDHGIYAGPLGDSGVRIEIRPGGSALGGETVATQMYKDPKILLGSVSTDESVRDSNDLPTVGVVSPLDRSPRGLMWDPAQFKFRTIAEIGRSKATVVHSEGMGSMDVLVSKKLLRRQQLDSSFDGSSVRFTTEEGIVQQAVATSDPYTYQRELSEWRKPVGFTLVDDSGFRPYPSLAVRRETLGAEADCLQRLVPRIQQAQVDYLDDPGPVNAKLPEIAREFAELVPLSAGTVTDGTGKLRDLKLVSNGTNGTIGDFDEARLSQVVTDSKPAFRQPEVDPVKPNVSTADVATNRFIDAKIAADTR